eukprot:1853323-Rhodomonas_salina.3
MIRKFPWKIQTLIQPDQLSKIPHAEDVPGLRELLEEFQDVFPDDLPAWLPVEREFEMKIPINPGSTPPLVPASRLNRAVLCRNSWFQST